MEPFPLTHGARAPTVSAAKGKISVLILSTKEAQMKVVKMSEAPKGYLPRAMFTGSDVTRQLLAPDSKEFDVSIVNFGKGLRNKFHAHEGEQILIVTSGEGIVATEDKHLVVTTGDVIFIPTGEKHWHGATEDSEFSHIYVTKAGATVTQLED
jgi:quercetin dioxygenase-like cupin family protein